MLSLRTRTGVWPYKRVVSFHVFVDVCATVDIKRKHAAGLLPYERTVAAFLFFNFMLSCAASVFAVKAGSLVLLLH